MVSQTTAVARRARKNREGEIRESAKLRFLNSAVMGNANMCRVIKLRLCVFAANKSNERIVDSLFSLFCRKCVGCVQRLGGQEEILDHPHDVHSKQEEEEN